MSLTDKIKISDISKSFGLANRDIINILAQLGERPKSPSKVLTLEELNFIFDSVTLSNQVEDISAALEKTAVKAAAPAAHAAQAAPAAKAESAQKPAAAQAGAPAKTEQRGAPAPAPASASAPAAEKPRQSQPQRRQETRYVDTRGSSVDLSRYDERIEKLVPDKAQHFERGKQKIRKAGDRRTPQNTGQKHRQEEQDRMRRLQLEIQKKAPIKVSIPDEISVGELAARLKKTAAEVVKKLIALGVMASVSEIIDFETASLVAMEFNAKIEHEVHLTIEERLIDDSADTEENLELRDPVVVVMGHVDHGKTSLLDAVRKTKVAAGEAGGITQHIGAYQIETNGKKITFLDTPGHAAFTSMRARGASVTDIAILVVSADDGIMPQTIEAINHAKAAEVPIIVAINKIDKPSANPDRIMQQLTEHSLIPEEWGGDTIVCKISALTGEGIDYLLDMVLLSAEMRELKANPNRAASGVVIEARLDKSRGPIATLLIQNGTLSQSDLIIAGKTLGRVRAMVDGKGKRIEKAGPSMPVEITGLDETPGAGDRFNVVSDERMARELADERKRDEREARPAATGKVTLDDLFAQIKEGSVKDLNVIIKADVQGSAEAVKASLEKLTNDEVRVRVIHTGVGAINENDVMLASASNAIVVGFNVRPDSSARNSAAQKGIDLRMYRVIYECIEEIEAAMKGLLEPEYKEEFLGTAEVRQVFKVTGTGTIAGSMVKEGKIVRAAKIRLVRDGVIIHEGEIASLKRFKDDAREVASGFECGIGFEKFGDIKEGDLIEAFRMVQVN